MRPMNEAFTRAKGDSLISVLVFARTRIRDPGRSLPGFLSDVVVFVVVMTPGPMASNSPVSGLMVRSTISASSRPSCLPSVNDSWWMSVSPMHRIRDSLGVDELSPARRRTRRPERFRGSANSTSISGVRISVLCRCSSSIEYWTSSISIRIPPTKVATLPRTSMRSVHQISMGTGLGSCFPSKS